MKRKMEIPSPKTVKKAAVEREKTNRKLKTERDAEIIENSFAKHANSFSLLMDMKLKEKTLVINSEDLNNSHIPSCITPLLPLRKMKGYHLIDLSAPTRMDSSLITKEMKKNYEEIFVEQFNQIMEVLDNISPSEVVNGKSVKIKGGLHPELMDEMEKRGYRLVVGLLTFRFSENDPEEFEYA